MTEEVQKVKKIKVVNVHRGPVFIAGEYLQIRKSKEYTYEELQPIKGKGYVKIID